MKVLAIESSAHTFGIAIVNEKGRFLADERIIYHTKSGGIVPQEAAKVFETEKHSLLKKTLEKAKMSLEEIDIIGVTAGPGLPPCLLQGVSLAKEIAKKYNKKIIPVNHIRAHLSVGTLLTKAKDPLFLFVSGANTQLITKEKDTYYILGETLDTGLGNALDKFARNIDLGEGTLYGPKIEEYAKKGRYIPLTYSVKGMDVAFSGIVTQATNLYKKGAKKEDLCYSMQETIFAMLTEITERAMAFTGKKELLLIGGVAANKRLTAMLDIMCKERKAACRAVPMYYAGDQAAMIAWQAMQEKENAKNPEEIDINPRWRVNQKL